MTAPRSDPDSHAGAARRFSRRQALTQGGAGLAATGLAMTGLSAAGAQDATPMASAAPEALPAEILAIIDAPRYTPSRWGVYVADLHTGAVVHAFRSDEWFLAASTSKLISGAAALDAFGPDFRFETPIYRHGELAGDGALHGNLILVASGDMTMGGRDTPDGHL